MARSNYLHRACLPSRAVGQPTPHPAKGCRLLHVSWSLEIAKNLLTPGQSCYVLPACLPMAGVGLHGLLSLGCVRSGHFSH